MAEVESRESMMMSNVHGEKDSTGEAFTSHPKRVSAFLKARQEKIGQQSNMSFFAKAQAMANDVANKVQETANNASVEAQIQYVNHQIDNLKAAWGKAAFDLAIAGDLAGVGNLAMAQKAEKDRLDAKLEALRAKKGGDAAPSSSAPPAQKMTVIVPAGAVTGSTFLVQMPDGTSCMVTVPPGAVPGSQITVDVPLNTSPVVQGVPLD